MIHLGERYLNTGATVAVCGYDSKKALLTENKFQVTCRKCRKSFHAPINNKMIFTATKNKIMATK